MKSYKKSHKPPQRKRNLTPAPSPLSTWFRANGTFALGIAMLAAAALFLYFNDTERIYSDAPTVIPRVTLSPEAAATYEVTPTIQADAPLINDGGVQLLPDGELVLSQQRLLVNAYDICAIRGS